MRTGNKWGLEERLKSRLDETDVIISKINKTQLPYHDMIIHSKHDFSQVYVGTESLNLEHVSCSLTLHDIGENIILL